MTDVSNLDDLARAISNASPNIRKYALAQAAATQGQEAAIRTLIEEVEVLKAKAGGGSGIPPTVPPDTPPPSPPPGVTLGFSLPARLPESTGSITNVASVSALQSAMSSVPDGSIINITTSLTGGGSTLILDASGAPSAPITITCNVGVSLNGFAQVLVRGNYMRIRGIEFQNATIDGLKIDVNAHHIDVDRCHVHHCERMGINIQPSPTDIQIWNCTIHHNGNAVNQNLDHNIYFGYARGNCVIGNCLIYETRGGYNIQIYPDAPGVIITGCTIDDYVPHAWARGGIVVGSEAGLTDNVKIVGTIGTNAAWYAVDVYDPTGGDTNNFAWDCLGFGNLLGDFRAGGGFSYINCTHADPLYLDQANRDYRIPANSPAKSKVQSARYGLLPQTDITGSVRLTADAGCYRAP